MSSLILVRGCSRPFTLKTWAAALPSFGGARGRRYSTEHKDDSQGVAEKARSTAEEFLRQAKEKCDSVSDSARDVVEDAKEAVLGESQAKKEKFKEKVEKGNYTKIGRD